MTGIPIDIRIIAGKNRDLYSQVKKVSLGKICLRLCVLELETPSFEKRKKIFRVVNVFY